MHLNHLSGGPINSFIDPAVTSTKYQSFNRPVKLVAKQGKRVFMSKVDAKSTFGNVPICFEDVPLLGLKFDKQFHIDCCFPFGAAISCTIFEHLANLV